MAGVVTVAFDGVEARRVDVEVQLTGGAVAFVVVGLGDKAVAESRERVRAAFAGLGLALPARRIIVNLAPADLPKEGTFLTFRRLYSCENPLRLRRLAPLRYE